MAQSGDTIATYTHFLMIAKNIERIGDYATNIAEQVYYIKTGSIIDLERIKADNSVYVTQTH